MFIEQGPTDCWIWQANPDDAPNRGALMACRNELCCNPRHFVEKQIKPKIEEPKKRGRPPKNAIQPNSVVK